MDLSKLCLDVSDCVWLVKVEANYRWVLITRFVSSVFGKNSKCSEVMQQVRLVTRSKTSIAVDSIQLVEKRRRCSSPLINIVFGLLYELLCLVVIPCNK